MNDIERVITRVITGILMQLKSAEAGNELSKNVQINEKEYKIAFTKEMDFILYRVDRETEMLVPLARAYNGVDDVSEAIDVISRRIAID